MRIVLVLVLLVGCRDRDREAAPRPTPRAAPTCDPAKGPTCAGTDVVECTADGKLGNRVQTCKDGCRAGACIDTCEAQGVELIYVVDDANRLLSFDPSKLPGDPFHPIGTLRCETSATPFSMAVDRRGVGWVLYNNGKLHRVSILDARCLSAGMTARPNAPRTYGMGFVASDAASETLFVAANDDSRALATIEIAQEPPRFATIAAIDAGQTKNPELTGTGDGKLFGYFPEPNQGFVTELDKTTGQPIEPRHPLGSDIGDVQAYAFAHWGGVFYVFATSDGHTSVHAIHRKDGRYERVRDDVPYRIVGAGVSTCAPLLERP